MLDIEKAGVECLHLLITHCDVSKGGQGNHEGRLTQIRQRDVAVRINKEQHMAKLGSTLSLALPALKPRCPQLRVFKTVNMPQAGKKHDISLIALVSIDILNIALPEQVENEMIRDLIKLLADLLHCPAAVNGCPDGMDCGGEKHASCKAVEAVGKAEEGIDDGSKASV